MQARVFIKQAQQSATTFDFPVSCSAYNSYHQVAWLGAGEKIEGENAEYSVSCARHMTIEGSFKGGEALPIISPRAMKKTHLFTNSVRKPVEFDIDNPFYGAACKLMVLHTTLPVVVLKDSPNSLYVLSDQFIDEKTMEREGVTIVSSFTFNKNEVIHHVVSHANSLYVFHAQGDFGADETSRITVLGIEPDRLKVEDREQPFVFHRIWTMASRQIQKNDSVLMADSQQPLAAFGSKIKTVEYDGRLFVGFSVTADSSGSACGLVRLGVRRKEKKKAPEKASDAAVESKEVVQAEQVPTDSSTPVVTQEEGKKEELVVEAPVEVDTAAVEPAAQEPDTASEVTPVVESVETIESVEPVESMETIEAVDGAVTSVEAAAEEKPEEEKVLLPETFDILDENLDHEVLVISVLPEAMHNKSLLPFYASRGQTVSISNLSAMYTSTAMSCLIFATDHEVSTLPLNSQGLVVTQGFIEDYFSGSNFISRSYKPDADDLRADQKRSVQTTITSFNVPQTIQDIQVAGDAVYIRYNDHKGVYSYRALFNDNGSIAGWQESERFARNKKVDFFFVGHQLPFTWYGYHDKKSCFFEQSMWEISTKLTEEFLSAVEQTLPQESYGVQGLQSLSCNELYTTRSALVATGYEGAVYGSFVLHDEAVEAINVRAIKIPGSGALVASAIASNMNEQQEWLLLGGVGGLYAQATADGSGFGVIESIDDLFTNDRSWRKIGNLTFVQKIVKNKLTDDFVYVVAQGGLYKVSMNQNMFTEPKVEQIFNAMSLGSKYDYVSDFFVDDNFVLVGTSKGLYAIDDVSKKESAYKIDLDGTVGAVVQMTSCRRSQDFDNLYVLSNDQFKQLSKVHRVVVKNKKCTLFADCTVEEFQKKNVGIKGSFLDMATACSSFYSNGTWYVKMNYPSYKREHEAIQCYQSGLKSGLDTVRTANRNLLRNMNLRSIDGAKNIAGMMHENILGCWIVFGDFGLRILS